MQDNLAHFLLSFSHDTIIIPAIVLGYIWFKQDIFYHACCLLLLSMLFNYALKITFQIPLNPLIGKSGFAFPSGHMQASSVFYGWLACNLHYLELKLLIGLLLLGIGASLVHFGYHNYVDVIGAVFFASLLMGTYWLASSKVSKKLPHLLSIFASILMLYVFIKTKAIQPHLWLGYYALVGFVLAEKVCANSAKPSNIFAKILATVLCFSALFAVHKIMAITYVARAISGLPIYITQLQWLIIGAVIPSSVWIAKIMSNGIKKTAELS